MTDSASEDSYASDASDISHDDSGFGNVSVALLRLTFLPPLPFADNLPALWTQIPLPRVNNTIFVLRLAFLVCIVILVFIMHPIATPFPIGFHSPNP